jgi:GNAT superfamily N-acetyltransferase
MKRLDSHLLMSAAPVDLPTEPMGLEMPDAATLASSLTLHRVANPSDPVFGELCRLLCADAAYWQQTRATPMTERTASELLGTLPAGAGPAQKYLWALRLDGRLVGCLDVLRQWPARNTLSIGLLMIHPLLRGQGIGHAALEQLRQRTRAWSGVRRWRVAVVETQAEARRFWRGKAFSDTGQRHPDAAYRAPLVVMERMA